MADHDHIAPDSHSSNCRRDHSISRLGDLIPVVPIVATQHVTPSKVIDAFLQSINTALIDKDPVYIQLHLSLCKLLPVAASGGLESVTTSIDCGSNDTQPEDQRSEHDSTVNDDQPIISPDCLVHGSVQTVITNLYQREEFRSLSKFCKALKLDGSKFLPHCDSDDSDDSDGTSAEENCSIDPVVPQCRKRRMITVPNATATDSKRPKRLIISSPEKRMYCQLCGNRFYQHKGDLRRHLQKEHLVPVELTEAGAEFDPKAKSCGPFTEFEARLHHKTKEDLEEAGKCHIVPKQLRETWLRLRTPRAVTIDKQTDQDGYTADKADFEVAMNAAKKHARETAKELANNYTKHLGAYKNGEYFKGSGRVSVIINNNISIHNSQPGESSGPEDDDEEDIGDGVLEEDSTDLNDKIDPRLF